MKTAQAAGMREISRAARQIGELFGVRRVILFGSHARGTAYAESDVDFLVIADTRRPVDLAGRILLHLGGRFASDVVVRTPREIRRAVHDGDSFLTGILREGVVLYEARRTRVGQQGGS